MTDIDDIYEGLDEPTKPKRSEKQRANDLVLNSTRPEKFEENYGPTAARKKAFLEALPGNNWCIAETARSIGLTPSAYYKWIKKDPEFRELIESQRRMVFDYAFDLAKIGMMGDLDLDARDRVHIALQLLRLQKASDVNLKRNDEGNITEINITII